MTEMVHPDPFLVSSHRNQLLRTCRVNRSTRINVLLRRTQNKLHLGHTGRSVQRKARLTQLRRLLLLYTFTRHV
jgi:hypothetical protein